MDNQHNQKLDDETLIKAFLKKQKEIQDQFLVNFANTKKTIDTTQLEKLVDEQKATLARFSTLKPIMDTSSIETSAKNALNRAVENFDFKVLRDKVAEQNLAIERNNNLLSNGAGKKLNIWLFVLALLWGLIIGMWTTWYFEVPAMITGSYEKEKLLETYRKGLNDSDNFVRYVNSSCKLKQGFASFTNQSIRCDQYWNSPKSLIKDSANK